MQIQRNNMYESAAGSLIAALAKGDTRDGAAVAFQQSFTASLDAIASRQQPSPLFLRKGFVLLRPCHRPKDSNPERG